MREIDVKQITDVVEKLCIEANVEAVTGKHDLFQRDVYKRQI